MPTTKQKKMNKETWEERFENEFWRAEDNAFFPTKWAKEKVKSFISSLLAQDRAKTTDLMAEICENEKIKDRRRIVEEIEKVAEKNIIHQFTTNQRCFRCGNKRNSRRDECVG